MPTGIVPRHARKCAKTSDTDAACSCKPTFAVWAYDPKTHKKLKASFPTLAAAKAWRVDALKDVKDGVAAAPGSPTVREAATALIAGMRDGSIRNRSGDEFKPSVIRSYETSLRLRILPELGARRLAEIERGDVQDLADRMLATELDPSTIRNALMPLRVIYRRALARNVVKLNPTSGVELPAVRGRRDRIASPDEAARFLEIVPERDRAIWAVALYAGLRAGELKALRVEDIDLAAGLIRVERSWDREGIVEPKSRAGRRQVPIPDILRSYLVAHRLRCEWNEGLAFGRSPELAFNEQVGVRAASAVRRAKDVAGLTLHEARHSYASLMIAAGVNAKALSVYMGHSSITITLDRYGHLLPGSEGEAAALLDNYLAKEAADV